MQKTFIKILVTTLLIGVPFGILAQEDSSPTIEDSTTAEAVTKAGNTSSTHLTTGGGGSNAGGSSIQADEFTGAATTSIPIPVPPARGGITPQLNLNYHSFRKNPNSWVGYGWELDFGSIERTPESGIVDYYEGTSFQARFSGQAESLELVEEESSSVASQYGITLDSGVLASRYQAKIEGAFNIYLHLRDHSDANQIEDKGWIVIDKGGNYYYFGTSWYSREETDASGADYGLLFSTEQQLVSRWLLDAVVDPNGNELSIGYDADRLPSRIEYQDITISFDKLGTSSNDIAYFPNYRQAILDREWMGVKLDSITIYQNGARLQKFDLEYEETSWNKFYQLTSVIQLGATDSEYLPHTIFSYYEQGDLEWYGGSQDYTASYTSTHGTDDGYINYFSQFADMNGDGLLDKVLTYADTDTVYVLFNNGSDFEYISGKSEWTDPFGNEECDYWSEDSKCIGKLNAYYYFGTDHHQWIYLIDMNGDGLPDRMKTIDDTAGNENQRDLEIAFNTGSSWSTSSVIWNDPFEGESDGIDGDDDGDYNDDAEYGYPGTADNDKFFMDMNGDGLVDRVVGHYQKNSKDAGFYVYYNTGAGFKTDYTVWIDPIYYFNENEDANGTMNAKDDYGIYATIRDFNGDGLPDRIFKTEINDGETGDLMGVGFSIFLNKNGVSWALPENEGEDGWPINGTDYLAILDPIEGEEEDEVFKGYINSQHDWIDMNGDGYLDRVIGDEETGKFTVHFFQGMTQDGWLGTLSDAYVMDDPITDDDDDYPARGYLNNTHWANDVTVGVNTYVMTLDINGDGYPDRVKVSPSHQDESSGSKNYACYLMRVNTVTFSDSPSWDNQNVTQPIHALKNIVSGQGIETVIEYVPSSWPQRWPVPTHRFLPFNVYLAHKIYTTDYSLVSGDTEIEALNHPGMRWTTYNYWGGNLFVRHAEKANPSDITDMTLSQEYFSQFNGFQTVEKRVFKSSYESWDDYEIFTTYYQSLGDIHTVDVAYESYFDQDAYSHFSFSGKPFVQEISTTTQTLVEEESVYEVDLTDPSENFDCDGVCFPKLYSHTKTVWEEGSANDRVSQVVFDYDDVGNVTAETHYDRNGAELITQNTTNYTDADFDTELQIRDRPQIQTKTLGGTVYHQKEFIYDGVGNPTDENYLISGSNYATVNRAFNSNGTVNQVTDVHGVTKSIGYDADGLFPISEQVTLPSGGTLTTTHEFNRMLGQPSATESDAGVGKLTTHDDFGRPLVEYVKDTTGGLQVAKRYSYEYVTATVENLSGVTLLKTQMWVPQSAYADTDTNPAVIAYSDPSGSVLQQCSYTERGDYRLVQSRLSNGGRLEKKTEPVFTSDCSFQSRISSSVVTYQTEKDIQGRPVFQDVPDGDVGSPVGDLTFSYTTNSDGQLVKTITDTNGLQRVETYDYQERLIKVRDPNSVETEFEYNAVGDLLNVSVGGTVITSMTYDLLGRKETMWDANLGTWVYAYDSLGRLDTQTDNKGQYYKYHYDSVSRVEKKEVYGASGALESYETYAYDAGDGTHDVLAGELFNVQEYDAAGTLLRETKFGYDTSYRRMNKITRGIVDLGDFEQTLTHDFRGLVQSVVYPGGESLYHTYNRLGGLEAVCSDSSCVAEKYYSIDPSSGYNVFGSLTKESFGNGVTQEFDYYANSHRLQQKKISKGSDLYSQRTYEYDIYSNISKLSDPLSAKGSGALENIEYDSLSRLKSYQTVDTSTVATLTYNDQGNILTNSAGFGTDTYEYTSAKPHAVTKIGSSVFTYDDNGNMLTDPDRTMTYNAKNQLIKVVMKNGMIVQHEYDYTGTRVKKHVSRADSYNHQVESTTQYLGDALEIKEDKLIVHIHAGGKKVATKTLGTMDEILSGSGSTFNWRGIDPAFRFASLMPYFMLMFAFLILVSVRPVPQSIPGWAWRSGFARRSSKHVIASEAPGRAWQSILQILLKFLLTYRSYARSFQETIAQLHHRRALKLANFFLVFLFLIQIPIFNAHAGDTGSRPGPSVSDENYFYYTHGDHLGSTHILTEGNTDGGKHSGLFFNRGDLIQRIEYSPFGQEKYVLNPNMQFEPGFTGQRYDIETGLYYYQSRYYNPKLSRFIQPDTVVPSATDLQSYNRYSYVNNNPLKYVDPSGHSLLSFLGKLLGAFIGGFLQGLGYALLVANPLLGAALIVAGSVVSGATSGGIKGALQGLINLTGSMGAALAGGIRGGWKGALKGYIGGVLNTASAIIGSMGPIGQAIVLAVGLGLSYATGGFQGMAMFASSMLGAYAGSAVGNKILEGGSKSKQDYDGGEQEPLASSVEVNEADVKGYGLTRPEGHKYRVGRDGTFVPEGEGIGSFLEDHVLGFHLLGVDHDAFVLKMTNMGWPDALVNIPSMYQFYKFSVFQETINSSVNFYNSVFDTNIDVPFVHSD